MIFRDYLQLLRRRKALPVFLVLLFAVAALAAVLLPAPQYAATAVIAAPANVGGSGQNQFTGLAGQRTFVTDIEAALTTPLIIDRVAKVVGVGPREVAGCLSAAPVGLSSVVDITCTAQHRRIVQPVAQVAAAATITFLFQPARDLASNSLQQAARQLATASAALRNFEAGNGPVVDRTYANDLEEVNQLRQIENAQIATGNAGAASSSAASLLTLQSQLLALPPKVAEFQILATAKTEAALNYDQAAKDFRQPLLQFNAADPSRTVSTTPAREVSRTPRLAHLLPPVTLAGLLVGIWLVAYPERVRQDRLLHSSIGTPRPPGAA